MAQPRSSRLEGTHTPSATSGRPLMEMLKRPQVYIPLMIVMAVLGLAFGLQPSSPAAQSNQNGPSLKASGNGAPLATATTASPQLATPAPVQPTPAPQQQSAQQPSQNNPPAGSLASNGAPASASPTGAAPNGVAGTQASPTSEVLGARATPTPDYTRDATQCGSVQESPVTLNVTQAILGVSIQATRATTYPIAYFRCILMATGGQEAVALAGSLSKSERAGMTHAVLVDLWFTNSAKDFGQVNLRNATLSVAGQVFPPLATLGGRSDVVVASGQGRNVTLVTAIKSTLGPTTGPMTVSVAAPMIGGKQSAGKYQLFLPTP